MGDKDILVETGGWEEIWDVEQYEVGQGLMGWGIKYGVYDRGLISNVYKELKKLVPRKPNNPIQKWGTELNRDFSPDEIRMAEKHLKKMFNIISH